MVLGSICSVKLLRLKMLSSVSSNQTWPIYYFTYNCQIFTANDRHVLISSHCSIVFEFESSNFSKNSVTLVLRLQRNLEVT